MICGVCRRQPVEIAEYIEAAKEEDITPDEYVRREEGTFNPDEGVFYCTECYIDIGMPNGCAHLLEYPNHWMKQDD